MYVDDMDLDDARDWEAYYEAQLDNSAINHPEHDSIVLDLEDIRERIAELEAG